MDAVLKLAEQLGKKLADQSAVAAFISAQQALQEDSNAQELLGQFEQQAQKMADSEKRNQPIEPDDKHKLADLQSQVSGDAVIKKFVAAQAEYMNLMRKVNQAIMTALHPDATHDTGTGQ